MNTTMIDGTIFARADISSGIIVGVAVRPWSQCKKSQGAS
jgi:hypothetical protein